MNNLVPEKRLDRNGKLVTKHVRSTPRQGSTRSAIPAPTADAKTSAKTATRAYKPLPRQTEVKYRSYQTATYPSNEPLTTKEQRSMNIRRSAYLGFNASDAELYSVMSATTSTGNALEIMARGDVRNAKDARAYLKKHKATELIADRSELMTAAFERGLSAETFIDGYEQLTERERESPFVLDAVEFKTSALDHGMNSLILDEIVCGDIAFSDLKAIGITRLKTNAKAYALTNVLTRLNKGEANFTVDEVKSFVIRAMEAKVVEESFKRAANFAAHRGFDLLQDKEDFELVNQNYYHVMALTSGFKKAHEDEPIEVSLNRIEYAVKLKKEVSGNFYYGYAQDFFDAGIPVDATANVVNAGGGVREAMAVHKDGIQSSVSGGWL